MVFICMFDSASSGLYSSAVHARVHLNTIDID